MCLEAHIWTLDAERCKSNLYCISDNTSFFLDQYVTYCSSIHGPATLGQYLELHLSASERA